MSNLINIKDSNNANWLDGAENDVDKDAINTLAICHKDTTEKNLEKTFYLYKKAAENNDVEAMKNLAMCYINGKGTEKNSEKAFYWYQKAAKKGDDNATKVFLSSGNKVIDDFIKYRSEERR